MRSLFLKFHFFSVALRFRETVAIGFIDPICSSAVIAIVLGQASFDLLLQTLYSRSSRFSSNSSLLIYPLAYRFFKISNADSLF